MPALDGLILSTGLGLWFGFSFPVFIHIGTGALASLPWQSSRRSVLQQMLEVFVRVGAIVIGLYAVTAFSIFQGQLNPARDAILYGMIAGIVAYVAMVKCYKKLKQLRSANGI